MEGVSPLSDEAKEEQQDRIARAAEGDWEAFTALRNDYHEALLGHILRKIFVGKAYASDIADEVWEAVREELASYEPARASFYTFLTAKIARRYVDRFLRERSRLRSLDAGGRYEAGAGAPDAREVQGLTEEYRQRARAYDEIFRLTFLCGGYPHEQLAFGFSKTLYAKVSPRAIEGSPKEVDEKHGDTPLARLIDEFWERYRRESGILDPGELQGLERHLQPLRKRLNALVQDLLRYSEGTDSLNENLLPQIVRETCLRDYYAREGGNFSASISDWCLRVSRTLRRVHAQLARARRTDRRDSGEGAGPLRIRACRRCKLRHVSPCGDQAPRPEHESEQDVP